MARARSSDRAGAPAAGGNSAALTSPPAAFFGWPGWRLLAYAWLLSVAQLAWFYLIYGGADWITAQRDTRYRVDLAIERHMPFLPAAVVLYMSMWGLFGMAPFVLRSRRQLDALSATLAAVTLVAGVCFLILPAELAYESDRDWGLWAGWYAVADRMNLQYNLVPSLHVTLSIVCVATFAARASSAGGRAVLWLWGAAIALSTLLTHEHHVLDAVSGWLLAVLGVRCVYRPMTTDRGSESDRQG
jgi:hypothetical protein